MIERGPYDFCSECKQWLDDRRSYGGRCRECIKATHAKIREHAKKLSETVRQLPAERNPT